MPNMCHDWGTLGVVKGVSDPRSGHFGSALRHSSAAVGLRSDKRESQRTASWVKWTGAKTVTGSCSAQLSPRNSASRRCIDNQHQRGGIMKNTIVMLACLLLAPLAFAQPGSTNKKQTTTETITVTGAVIKMTTEEGAAANYKPVRTLVIREDKSKRTARYVVNGRGRVLNKAGQAVQTAIKPGARVLVYYATTNDLRTIDHVVVVD